MATLLTSMVGIALLGLAAPACALDSTASSNLPAAAVFSSRLLPDAEGVVSWKTLASVESVKQGSRIVPRFSKDILGLDRQQVRIHGFILALDTGLGQKHFLLSAVPPHCPYCLPAGPDAIVEVFARKPVQYGYEPIVVSGKFTVLRDDPSGVLYRLHGAELVPGAAH
jgi:hypothetical protein